MPSSNSKNLRIFFRLFFFCFFKHGLESALGDCISLYYLRCKWILEWSTKTAIFWFPSIGCYCTIVLRVTNLCNVSFYPSRLGWSSYVRLYMQWSKGVCISGSCCKKNKMAQSIFVMIIEVEWKNHSRHPLLRIQNVIDNLGSKKFFILRDQRKANHQLNLYHYLQRVMLILKM